MQKLEIKLHYYQKQILKKILYAPDGLHFAELLIEGLESEHMNYHLQKLVDFELVEKVKNVYVLTHKGKDYVNTLDDTAQVVEKQPKVSVLVKIRRFNEAKGDYEYLVYKKLRQPYYGKVGTLGGKVRFGVAMEDAARREIFEETGLKVAKLVLLDIYRKMRKNDAEEFVQDVIFFIFLGEDVSGHLIEKSEVQENFWGTLEELSKRDDLFDDFTAPNEGDLRYEENIGLAVGF